MKKHYNQLKLIKTSLCIFFLFLIATISLTAQSLGDVNNNGDIDIIDSLLIAQHYVGLSPADFNSDYADVDCSGDITIIDALLIAQFYVRIITQLPCTTTPTPAGGNITVWMAGDSTMARGLTPCPVGWGELFNALFDSRVTVINRAIGGRGINNWMYSVQSTADSGGDCVIDRDGSGNPVITSQWQAILDGMHPGDYLLISFGINDGTTACPRHADETTFKTDLGIMAQAAKARGANPVFLTPVSMIACSGSVARGSRGAFVDYTFAAGQTYDVPVIDLHQLSVDYYNFRGFCPLPNGASDVTSTTGGEVGAFFCDDHTHFDTPGATAIAQVVATAIRNQGLGLASYLK